MKSERLKKKGEKEKRQTPSLHHSKLERVNYGVFIS